MTTARSIITLALESMNRLSPGEAIDADVAAACLRRLNAIADEWSCGTTMPPQDQIVAGVVTGSTLTLGQGDFAGISPGDEIAQLQADNYPMSQITMQQYNIIYFKDTPGRPDVWAYDGLSTIYLYPVATGNTLHALSRKSFSQFADVDTDYLLPSGYQSAFAAKLAVAMAPALLGGVTADLLRAESRATFNVTGANIRPAVLNASPLTPNGAGNIYQGWNR